jgi:hypothetical protein
LEALKSPTNKVIQRCNPLKRMARLKGFEPLAHCLEGSCSIRLSYRRTSGINIFGIFDYKNLFGTVSRTGHARHSPPAARVNVPRAGIIY